MDIRSTHPPQENGHPPRGAFVYEGSQTELDRMTFLSSKEREQLKNNPSLAKLEPFLTPSWVTTAREAFGKNNFFHFLQGVRPETISSLPEEIIRQRIEQINTSPLVKDKEEIEPLLGVQIELLKQPSQRFESLMELASLIGAEKTRFLLFASRQLFFTDDFPKEAIVHASQFMSPNLFSVFLEQQNVQFLSWLSSPDAKHMIEERVNAFGMEWWAEINTNVADPYDCAQLFFHTDSMEILHLLNKRRLSVTQKKFIASFITRAGSQEETVQMINFVEHHLPDKILESLGEERLYQLKQMRAYFLQALSESLTDEQIQQFLDDKETFDYIKNASDKQRTVTRISADRFEALARRDKTPIEFEPGVPDRKKQEIQEMIDVLGIEPLLRQLATKVIIEAQREQEECNGMYGIPSAEIRLRAYGEMGSAMSLMFTHEVGHALNEYLMAQPEAEYILSKFTLTTIFSVHRYSSYAEAYGEKDGHNSEDYVSEVFAEDFAIFLATPDYLPTQKRIFFEQIFVRYFPTIDYQLIRQKIASLLGNFYGLSLAEVVEETECDTIAWHRKEMEKEELPKRHYLAGVGFSGSDMDYYQMKDEDYSDEDLHK